jgi:Glycosyl transferase family 2
VTKLVMTLVVRDEVDVVGDQIAYHLAAGVDFVLATDHGSTDGTTEILESYERAGRLRLFRATGEMRESDWRTDMARRAAREHEADWVVNTDADEFWVPREGSLEDSLAAVPPAIGIVWALTCHFVPRPDDGRPFAERMTARYSATAALNDPTSPYRPHAKAVHRADPNIVVWFGSHRVDSDILAPLPGWHPADVFHFPFRSVDQYERKNVRRARGDKPLGQYVRGLQARERGRIDDAYAALVVDDDRVASGVANGSLVVDPRLRDAIAGRAPTSPPDRARFARDEAALRDADLVRVVRRLDGVDARVDAVETRRRRWTRR